GSITGKIASVTELEDGNFSIILTNSTYDVLFWNDESDIIDEFNQVFVSQDNIVRISRIFDCSNGEIIVLENSSPMPSTSASIDVGVYFARGIFNYVGKQTIPISVTSSSISARIGLL